MWYQLIKIGKIELEQQAGLIFFVERFIFRGIILPMMSLELVTDC